MNEVAAAPYVLLLSLELYIYFRVFSIYRVFRICRRECYGINFFSVSQIKLLLHQQFCLYVPTHTHDGHKYDKFSIRYKQMRL